MRRADGKVRVGTRDEWGERWASGSGGRKRSGRRACSREGGAPRVRARAGGRRPGGEGRGDGETGDGLVGHSGAGVAVVESGGQRVRRRES